MSALIIQMEGSIGMILLKDGVSGIAYWQKVIQTYFINNLNQNNMKVDYLNKKVLSEEAVENSQVEYAVESTKLELQSALLATKKSLAEAKSALEDLKSNYPINIEAIVKKQLEVRDYTNGIEIIESLQKEYGFK
jgi:hypothetical protein